MNQLFQAPNGAWNNFLIEGLGFKTWMMGVISVSGTVTLWMGMLLYRVYLHKFGWRLAFFLSAVGFSLISLAQVMTNDDFKVSAMDLMANLLTIIRMSSHFTCVRDDRVL